MSVHDKLAADLESAARDIRAAGRQQRLRALVGVRAVVGKVPEHGLRTPTIYYYYRERRGGGKRTK